MERLQVQAYVEAAAAALDLPIAVEHRAGVVHYFELAAAMSELVVALPLGIDDEPAPVFTPIAPDSVAESSSAMRP